MLALAITSAIAAPVEPPTPTSETYDPGRSLAPLVEAVAPTVVTVMVEKKAMNRDDLPPELRRFFGGMLGGDRPVIGNGSGVLISDDGLLITNAHVVDGADSLSVVLHDGSEVEATVLGSDASIDIALLDLEGDDWAHATLGSSAELRVGDHVVAMGNGLGLGTTVTTGILSGKGRDIGSDWQFGTDDFLQTDAAINQGNSGGPLFDLYGNVVGINTAIIQGANTVGFSIPIDMVKQVMPDLKKDGRIRRGFLGVRPGRAGDDAGALIAEIIAGTPAATSGLEVGDIVTGVDGSDVATPDDLVHLVANRRPGETVMLAVNRDDKQRTIELTLGERPREDGTPFDSSSDDDPAVGDDETLGVSLSSIGPGERDELGVSNGVRVMRVDGDALAAGYLEAGDVIIEVNGRKVKSPGDKRTRGWVKFVVLRDGAQHYVVVKR